jgi:NitT/TauT family transport system substrate-binding protein
VIACGSTEYPALTPVAGQKELIWQNDLHATMRNYPTDAPAFDDLFSGAADVADTAKFMGTGGSFSSPGLRIIATTAKSDKVTLVIRDDRGIRNHSDLNGVNYDPRGYRPYLETEKLWIIA